MAKDSQSSLQLEWAALHKSYDQFDVLGLVVKLVAVAVAVLGLMAALAPVWTAIILAVLWLQEAIWKTFQGRTEQRLLAIEAMLKAGEGSEGASVSFYSDWEASRPGTVGLVTAYLANTLRPTIAYPYVVLIALVLLTYLL